MKEIVLEMGTKVQLEKIYDQLQNLYEAVAKDLDFSCTGCPDNCCDSYFLHHTYVEWAYLWYGFSQLEPSRQQEIQKRARAYLLECERMEARGERPQVMCPLIENGRCGLYQYRMLVCRTHGVPAKMIRPDGQTLHFPGCFRCQEVVEKLDSPSLCPSVDRTPLLKQLVLLENELLDGKRHLYPKVRLTIAEMLIKGPPALPFSHCDR